MARCQVGSLGWLLGEHDVLCRLNHMPNQPRQPMPGARLACISVSLARRGCADSLDEAHMKAISAIFGAAVLFLVAAVLWYRWDSATNRGYKRGYWGQFNTVSNELSALPGVIIVKPWYNADLTLEEFGFDLLTQ